MTELEAVNDETQRFLRALASETRQRIMLVFSGGESLTVGEVAARCGLGQSTASEQLSVLKQGGLLAAARSGKSVHYQADAGAIRARLEELQSYLGRCC